MARVWYPTWPLPVLSAMQAYYGLALAAVWLIPVDVLLGDESLAGTGSGEVFIFLVLGTLGPALVFFGLRNCLRLWRVGAWEATWTTAAAAAVVGTLVLLPAVEVLRAEGGWEALPFVALGGYYLVVAVREVVRRCRMPLRRQPFEARIARRQAERGAASLSPTP